MTHYHLAQVNIARLNAPLDSPTLASFVTFLDPINALADLAPGFVWRFQTEAGDATSLRPYDDEMIIVNFSVWESVEALKKFTYQGSHGDILRMRKRERWFAKMTDQYQALWWVPAGDVPTWEQARERLDTLRRHGETPYAFTFRTIFTSQAAEDYDSGKFGTIRRQTAT